MEEADYKAEYEKLNSLADPAAPETLMRLETFLSQAMSQGLPRAFADTAIAMIQGHISDQRFGGPMKLLRESESLGSRRSFPGIGYCYARGFGVERDDSQALPYLESAVTDGDTYAHNELAAWYAEGRLVEKDTDRAVQLLSKSEELGSDAALKTLADWYERGENVQKDIDKAFERFKKLADKGDGYGCYKVGRFHATGTHVQRDGAEAFRYYSKGAELGYACASCGLGDCYIKGFGVEENAEIALQWYKRAIDAECPYAMLEAAEIYRTGERVERQIGKALRLQANGFARQKELGQNTYLADYYLSRMLDTISTAEIDAETLDSIKVACDLNNSEAYVALFRAHYVGSAARRNVSEARSYLKSSNRSGFKSYLGARGEKLDPFIGIDSRHKHFDVWALAVFEILYQAAVGDDSASNSISSEVSSDHFNVAEPLRSAIGRLASAVDRGWRLGADSPLIAANFKDFAASISSRSSDASLIADYAFAAGRMATALRLPDAAAWNGLMMIAEAQTLGVELDEFLRMSTNVGIVHNALTPLGTPVPGLIRRRLEGDPTGFARLEGVSVSGSDVTLIGKPSHPHELPLIIDEDREVAIALAFAELQPLDASFSLETHGKLTPEYRAYTRLDVQWFSPEWLAQTEAGKALYWADHLMKSMSMRDGFMSLFDPTVSSSLDPHFEIPKIVEELQSTHVDDYDGMGGRHAIMLKSIDYSVERRGLGTAFDLLFRDINVFIDGSYVRYEADGSEDRSVRPNDPNTSVGKWGALFTENYELISSLFPVFERVRQLLALFKLVAAARDEKLVNEAALQRKAQSIVQRFSARSRSEKILAPKPWHRGGCWCQGGVSMRNAEARRREDSDPRSLPVGGGPFSLARDLGSLKEKSVALIGQREAKNVFMVKTSSNRAMLVAADGYTGYKYALQDVNSSHDASKSDADHVIALKTRQQEGVGFVAIASVPKDVNRGHGAAIEKTASPLRVDADGKIWMSNYQAAKLAGLRPEELHGGRYARDPSGNDVFQAGLTPSQKAEIQRALTFEITEVSKPLTWMSALQAEFKVNS